MTSSNSYRVLVAFLALTGALLIAVMFGYDARSAAQTASHGEVFSWGRNVYGQLGNGTNAGSISPVQVKALTDAKVLDAGAEHNLALKSDGTVWAWGWNGYGQLGDGTNADANFPVQVQGLTNVKDIAAGHEHSVAVNSDGTVWAWGRNNFGALGDGTTINRNAPVQVQGLTGVKAVAAGAFYSLALKNDGTVWAWGYNGYCQLGDGTVCVEGSSHSLTPVQVKGVGGSGFLTGVKDIDAGYWHSLALKNEGTLVGWGANNTGQLGDGNPGNYLNAPVQVKGVGGSGFLTGVKDIDAGAGFTLTLMGDGKVYSWGFNGQGQLGDGTYSNSSTPVQVQGLTDAVAIVGGDYHALAAKNDGTVWAWGWNGFGQLGTNTVGTSSTPIQVAGLADKTVLAAGHGHNLAAKGITNATPTAADDTETTNEDQPKDIDVLINDTDSDGDTLTVSQASTPSHGTATVNADGTVLYEPEVNYNGTDSFTYTVSDGKGGTATATVNVTVNAVNDAPSFDLPVNPNQTVNEDAGAQSVSDFATNISAGPANESGQKVSFAVTNTNISLFADQPEISPDGTLTHRPAQNASGRATVSVVAKDDGGTGNGGDDTSDEHVFTITVNPVNDAPTARDDRYQTSEDTELTIAAPGVLGNDADAENGSLTAKVISGPAEGTLTLSADGSFVYTPDNDFHGEDVFTYKGNDGTEDGNLATVSIRVDAVNDGPVAADDAYEVDEDGTLTVPASGLPGLLDNDGDADQGDQLAVTSNTEPQHGSVTVNAHGSFTYKPSANYEGTDTFEYVVSDVNGRTDTATVTITVKPANDAPTADAGGPYAVDEGGSVGVSVSGSDPEGGALAYEWDLDANGTFETQGKDATFSADDGPGSYKIKVRTTDPHGAYTTDEATVTVANIAPTVTGISGPEQALLGKALSFTASATDPSSADRSVGFSWQWATDGGAYSAASNPFSTTFSGCGDHTVSAKATDKDGGVSEPLTTNVLSLYETHYRPPLNEGMYNLVQAGKVVPVKISSPVGCDGSKLTGLSPAIQLLKGDKSDGTESGSDVVETTSTSGADTTGVMRAVQDGYIYNLKVPTIINGVPVRANDLLTIRIRPFGDSNQGAGSMYILLKIKK